LFRRSGLPARAAEKRSYNGMSNQNSRSQLSRRASSRHGLVGSMKSIRQDALSDMVRRARIAAVLDRGWRWLPQYSWRLQVSDPPKRRCSRSGQNSLMGLRQDFLEANWARCRGGQIGFDQDDAKRPKPDRREEVRTGSRLAIAARHARKRLRAGEEKGATSLAKRANLIKHNPHKNEIKSSKGKTTPPPPPLHPLFFSFHGGPAA